MTSPEVPKTSAPAPPRIVSLLASATELVCALGLGEHLVGRSHECDGPEGAKALTVVSAPTFAVTGTSRDIDERVRQLLRAGKPLYAVDEALLDSLHPDVVITVTDRGLTVPKVAIGIVPTGRPGAPVGPIRVTHLAVTLKSGKDELEIKNKNSPSESTGGWKSAADDVAKQIEKWIAEHRAAILSAR